MTAHLARSASGHLEKTTNGHLALCGAGCPYPTMLLTVTGTTGNINWCGETWTLPADSGVQKEVCPDFYGKGQSSTYNTGTSMGYPTLYSLKEAEEKWSHHSMYLQRFYNKRRDGFTVGLSYDTVIGSNNLSIRFPESATTEKRISRYNRFTGFTLSTGTVTSKFTNNGGFSSAMVGNVPDFTDYSFTAAFFGSYTDGDSITYAWEKGTGW